MSISALAHSGKKPRSRRAKVHHPVLPTCHLSALPQSYLKGNLRGTVQGLMSPLHCLPMQTHYDVYCPAQTSMLKHNAEVDRVSHIPGSGSKAQSQGFACLPRCVYVSLNQSSAWQLGCGHFGCSSLTTGSAPSSSKAVAHSCRFPCLTLTLTACSHCR